MMKRPLFGAAAVTAIGLMAGTASAQTQWLEDTLSDQCSAEAQSKVADITRESIEASVRRAEASIQEPASIADLSCLNDLLGANIDVFSKTWRGFGGFNIEAMINDIAGGLKSGLSIQSLSGGVERALCEFAEEKFSELTSGVTSSIPDLLDPTTVLDQMPSFTDGFSSLNIPLNASTGSSAQDLDGDGYPDDRPDTATGGPDETEDDTVIIGGDDDDDDDGGSSPIVISDPNVIALPTSSQVSTGGGSDSDDTVNIQSIWDNISGGN